VRPRRLIGRPGHACARPLSFTVRSHDARCGSGGVCGPRQSARLVSAVLAAILLVAPVWVNGEGTEADGAPDTVPAVWTPQQLRLKLIDSRGYTCNEFRIKVKQLLLALGARKDLQVEACVDRVFPGPSEDPQVAITMQVLKIAAGSPTDQNGVRAHWKGIDLVDHHGPLGPDECLLAKLIVDSLLPLFSTRNVEYSSPSCERIVNVRMHLRLEVLVPGQS